MVRGMKKRNEDAKLAIEELESLSNKLGGSSGAANQKIGSSSGRMVFGVAAKAKQAPKSNNKPESDKIKSDNFYDNSDSENDLEAQESDNPVNNKSNHVQRDVDIDSVSLHEDCNVHQDSLFKSFDDIVQESGSKTSHEVAIFASGAWKKMLLLIL